MRFMTTFFDHFFVERRNSMGLTDDEIVNVSCYYCLTIGTFRSEDEDDYRYECSALSTRTSKNVGLQTLCACSVRKTRTGTRPRPPI